MVSYGNKKKMTSSAGYSVLYVHVYFLMVGFTVVAEEVGWCGSIVEKETEISHL